MAKKRKTVRFIFYESWVLVSFNKDPATIGRLKTIRYPRRRFLPVSKMWALTYPLWKWNSEHLFPSDKADLVLDPLMLAEISMEELGSLPLYEGSYSPADDEYGHGLQ